MLSFDSLRRRDRARTAPLEPMASRRPAALAAITPGLSASRAGAHPTGPNRPMSEPDGPQTARPTTILPRTDRLRNPGREGRRQTGPDARRAEPPAPPSGPRARSRPVPGRALAESRDGQRARAPVRAGDADPGPRGAGAAVAATELRARRPRRPERRGGGSEPVAPRARSTRSRLGRHPARSSCLQGSSARVTAPMVAPWSRIEARTTP